MGELVDEHQIAFLKGRQIMDAALLANELVDTGQYGETESSRCPM